MPYDEQLLAFLRLDELLVDVGDDLTDYEDDVVGNSFNIYRCYVALHGPEEASLRLAAYIGDLETRHAVALAALPPDVARRFWARHGEASAAPRSGAWVLPTPIALTREAAFRRRFGEGGEEG